MPTITEIFIACIKSMLSEDEYLIKALITQKSMEIEEEELINMMNEFNKLIQNDEPEHLKESINRDDNIGLLSFYFFSYLGYKCERELNKININNNEVYKWTDSYRHPEPNEIIIKFFEQFYPEKIINSKALLKFMDKKPKEKK